MKIWPLKFRRIVLGLVSILPSFNASSSLLNFDALVEKLPSVTIPFSLSKKGSVFTADLDAGAKTYTYTFYLNFLIKDNAEELQRVTTLLGLKDPKNGGTYKDVNGQLVEIRTGIPIDLRLTISRLDGEGESLVYDKKFHQLWSLGGNNSSILKAIDRVKLEPAHYKVRLESLAVVNELADIPVNFQIGLPGKH